MSSGLELDESDLTIDNMNQLANESMQDLEYYQSVWNNTSGGDLNITTIS